MYFTPSLLASHVVPQRRQTTINAKMALALVPFFRMVKGFNADRLFKASVDCDKVLLKSNKGIASESSLGGRSQFISFGIFLCKNFS